MLQFRRLTDEELQALESDFINFLVVQGIPAEDWQRIKAQDPDRTEDLIASFSNMILHTVLEKTTYLEHFTKKQVFVFAFEVDQVHMITMSSDDLDTDFTDHDYIHHAMQHPPADLQIGKQSKSIDPLHKAQEVWSLIQTGCLVSDGKLYEVLKKIKPG